MVPVKHCVHPMPQLPTISRHLEHDMGFMWHFILSLVRIFQRCAVLCANCRERWLCIHPAGVMANGPAWFLMWMFAWNVVTSNHNTFLQINLSENWEIHDTSFEINQKGPILLRLFSGMLIIYQVTVHVTQLDKCPKHQMSVCLCDF